MWRWSHPPSLSWCYTCTMAERVRDMHIAHIRIPHDLRRRIRIIAAKELKSQNKVIIELLEKALSDG